MATGRIRRSARRGLAGALLLWLAILVSVVVAPGASADPNGRVDPVVDVFVRDLTPPYVSIDDGDTVRFTNQIQDKTVQVGGGGLLPTLVSVTVSTEVTLTMPSGTRVLPPGASWDETFDRDCSLPGIVDVCLIGYTYRLQSNTSLTSALTDAVFRLLPPLPVPTPFVVTTLPLPNLPGVNLPQLPVIDVPTLLPGVTEVLPQLVPQGEAPTPTQAPVVPQAPTASGVDGLPYAYDTGLGAADMSPTSGGVTALDLSRFTPASGGGPAGGGAAAGGGSGGRPGGFDGASVPVFGQLSGLEGDLDEESATSADPAGSGTGTLPLPALVAVVALAASTAALVRTQAATRTTGGSHRSR